MYLVASVDVLAVGVCVVLVIWALLSVIDRVLELEWVSTLWMAGDMGFNAYKTFYGKHDIESLEETLVWRRLRKLRRRYAQNVGKLVCQRLEGKHQESAFRETRKAVAAVGRWDHRKVLYLPVFLVSASSNSWLPSFPIDTDLYKLNASWIVKTTPVTSHGRLCHGSQASGQALSFMLLEPVSDIHQYF